MGEDFKIRTLPRGNEHAEPKKKTPKSRRTGPVLALVGVILVLAFLAFKDLQPPAKERIPAQQKGQPAVSDSEERVTRYLREGLLKKEMEKRALEVENEKLTNPAGERPQAEVWDPPKDRVYGLQLDQEDRSGKVYEDLKGNRNSEAEMSPEERINARLENSKWINEMERAEQKQFVANFIRQAADNGYEITLNDQLVVVKVKRIPGRQKVPIEKILDQLNRQPSSH